MSDETGNVVYTVKELLAKLDGKVDTIILSLSNKAEKKELDDLAKRVTSLEATRTAGIALSNWQRWFIGTVCLGFVGCVITLVALVLGGH